MKGIKLAKRKLELEEKRKLYIAIKEHKRKYKAVRKFKKEYGY